MSNIFMGFEIGKRAIMTSQTALNVTGHNIANTNTPGYSRQSANLITNRPWHTLSLTANASVGQFGTGVDVKSITRMRDAFVDAQIRQENKTTGYWQAIQESLSRIEGIVNEPSNDGLRSVMDNYWEAWQDLSANPESEAVRAVAVQRGMAMADVFNHTYRQLEELRADVNDNINIKVNEINSISTQLANLNKQILAIKVSGMQPNDLEDKRDLLLDQLSKIIDITVYYDSNDMTAIQFGGRNLVQGVESNLLATKQDDEGLHMVIWKDTEVKAQISGGELRGYLDIRGKTGLDQERTPSEYREIITKLMDQLNALAKTIVVKTNDLHRGGYSLVNQSAIPDGTNFFVCPEDFDDIKDWAKNFRVSNELIINPKKIAAASQSTWDQNAIKNNFGDGSNALKIAQLKHDLNNNVIVTMQTDIPIIIPATQAQIDFDLYYGDQTVRNVTISADDYNDVDSLATALSNAINIELGTNLVAVNINPDNNKIIFTSRDKDFKIENLKIGVEDIVLSQTTTKDNSLINDATTDDYWRSLAANVGVESQESKRMVNNQEVLIGQLENKRQSLSGVSLDEEMTNMVKFQHAYNAAARFITTIDEQLDQIINRLGLVGR